MLHPFASGDEVPRPGLVLKQIGAQAVVKQGSKAREARLAEGEVTKASGAENPIIGILNI